MSNEQEVVLEDKVANIPMTDQVQASGSFTVTHATAKAESRIAAAKRRMLLNEDVAADLARVSLNSIPVGFAGGVIPAAVLAWVLRGQVPAPALLLWFAWMVLAHSARVAIWLASRPEAKLQGHAGLWLLRARVSVLVLGASWAVLPLFMFPTSPIDQLFMATVIAAVCGAGVAQQSSDAPSALLFMLPSAITMGARLLLSPEPLLQAAGYLAVLYFAYLALATRRIYASFLELSRLRANAERQSLYDPLTRLPNRSALSLRLNDALARAKREGTEVAVGYVDLDDFKRVNDTHGHDAGDALLREVAQRWRDALRETELIARLGGDEFAIVIENIDPDSALGQLTAVFDRVHQAVGTPISVALNQFVEIGMTMGVARYPIDGTDADMLLRQADEAMYQLKRQKATRTHWWQLGVKETQAPRHELPRDP